MGSVKVKIRFNDAEFEADGSRDDVDAMLAVWWGKVLCAPAEQLNQGARPDTSVAKSSNRKTPSSRASTASKGDATNSQKFDSNSLANKIKQLPNASTLTEKIWHQSNVYNKIALVCLLAEEPLTSGDIQRVLVALKVKLSLPNVSTAISKNSNKFLQSNPRKAGGTIVRYELTSSATNELHKVINAKD